MRLHVCVCVCVFLVRAHSSIYSCALRLLHTAESQRVHNRWEYGDEQRIEKPRAIEVITESSDAAFSLKGSGYVGVG